MKTVQITMLAVLLAVVANAQQASPISLDVLSKKVVVVIADDGSKKEQLEAIKKVLPGETVQYRLVCRNNGVAPADKVVIGNPLPDNMLYIEGSATTEDAVLSFSADGGKSFAPLAEVTVNEPAGTRPARIGELTNVQWIFTKPLQPGSVKEVVYRARLK